MLKMRLRPGLRPGPRWGSSRSSPRPPSRPHSSRRLHSRAFGAPSRRPPTVFWTNRTLSAGGLGWAVDGAIASACDALSVVIVAVFWPRVCNKTACSCVLFKPDIRRTRCLSSQRNSSTVMAAISAFVSITSSSPDPDSAVMIIDT